MQNVEATYVPDPGPFGGARNYMESEYFMNIFTVITIIMDCTSQRQTFLTLMISCLVLQDPLLMTDLAHIASVHESLGLVIIDEHIGGVVTCLVVLDIESRMKLVLSLEKCQWTIKLLSQWWRMNTTTCV